MNSPNIRSQTVYEHPKSEPSSKSAQGVRSVNSAAAESAANTKASERAYIALGRRRRYIYAPSEPQAFFILKRARNSEIPHFRAYAYSPSRYEATVASS